MTLLDARPAVTPIELDQNPPPSDRSELGGRLAVLVTPQAPILIAVGLVVLGFGLLAYTWVRVSTLKIVAAQVPYLISSGLTGIGFVIFGAALLLVGARRNDDVAKRKQDAALIRALSRIDAALMDGASDFTTELPRL